MFDKPFWETIPLNRMSRTQWESLCDGCGKCCVHKLEDDETGELFPTNVACRLLDPRTALCKDYPSHGQSVGATDTLTVYLFPSLGLDDRIFQHLSLPYRVKTIDWLPSSCGYLRVHRGQGLADWHPLISGDPNSVHRAGISVRGKTVSEDDVGDLENHIIEEEL